MVKKRIIFFTIFMCLLLTNIITAQNKRYNYKNIVNKQDVIFGIITLKDNTYYITENWKTRSLVTYKIENEFKDIDKYVNKPVLGAGKKFKSSTLPYNRVEINSITRYWEEKTVMTIAGTVKDGKNCLYFVEQPIPHERFVYIIEEDKTNSIKNYINKTISIQGTVKQENNWNKIYLYIEAINP